MYKALKTLMVGDGIKVLPGQTVVGVGQDEIPGLLQTRSIEYIPDPVFPVAIANNTYTGSNLDNEDEDTDDEDDPESNTEKPTGNTLSAEDIKKFDRMTKAELLALCMDNGIYDLSNENTKAEIISELTKAGVPPVTDNGTT